MEGDQRGFRMLSDVSCAVEMLTAGSFQLLWYIATADHLLNPG